MASIQKEISTNASVDQVWSAISDIGALHTRLVPGFVIDTRLEPGGRIVTFGNGMVIREPIVDINEERRRLVWSAIGGSLTHYNASAQVFADAAGQTRVVWIAERGGRGNRFHDGTRHGGDENHPRWSRAKRIRSCKKTGVTRSFESYASPHEVAAEQPGFPLEDRS